MRRTFSFGDRTCTVTVCDEESLYDGLPRAAFFVADRSTERYLPGFGSTRTLRSGEIAKSWGELELLLGAMLAADLSRDSVVVGVGGGVICDISALAASLYMRGCELVLVPTTLLAMVDAALGGKTGVNFGGYKNMIGTFYPAGEVRLAPHVLATLPEREYRSGIAEVIKTALLGDVELLETMERDPNRLLSRDAELLAEVVWRCVAVKGAIVEDDLRESGVRAHLNLGHTFAHALESVQGLGSWSHGEAVAWGLARAMELGLAAGLTDGTYARRVRALLERFDYRLDPIPEATTALLDAMRKDKKRRGSEIRFVLQHDLGRTLVTTVDARLVEAVLRGAA